MSKRNYTQIIISGLVLILMLFFTAAICNAAGQDDKNPDETKSAGEQVGKEDPFTVVDPSTFAGKQIIQSVEGTGITQAQLQAAMQAAMQASGNSNSVAGVVEPVKIIPERRIKSIMLKFLRAANVLPVVNRMLTEYGTASIDEQTNTLIVCDAPENIDNIIAQVAKADKTPQQILVEVVIIDVQLSNDTELGVNWDNLIQGSVSYVQQLNKLGNAAGSGGSLTLIKGSVENTIKALQRERKTEILASPRVLVLSGQEAMLETIEEIPYTDITQTSAGGGGDSAIASTKFKNAGITLTVKPTVTDDGRIMIEIQPSQSINTGVAGVGNSTVPIVDRRTVKTTLLMEDGDIAVIGGLRSKNVKIVQDKIPLLGDLPFIGGFFSNDKEVVENSELLILISPHVYNGRDDLKKSEEALWNEVKNLEPIRLRRKIRPEQEFVKKIVPQNKLEKK
ncbi:MAG: type II secretion system protein GspD [Planctomycetes bacterium]|nr:type II secretion system protein GspD [Planctomycetota bacterium]